MKISRHGSGANYGSREVHFPEPKFSWSEGDAVLQVKQSRVRDFNTYADHNYVVSISVEEFINMLQVLAGAAMQDPARLAPALANALPAITQLQAVGAGIVRA